MYDIYTYKISPSHVNQHFFSVEDGGHWKWVPKYTHELVEVCVQELVEV